MPTTRRLSGVALPETAGMTNCAVTAVAPTKKLDAASNANVGKS
jgi:hypothetical protein